MALPPRLKAALLALLATAGCSHGTVSALPVAPTPTGPTITALTVTPVGGGIVIEGSSVPITADGPFPSTGAALGAFAQYSDGSGKYVAAAWTSSDDRIVSVDGAALNAKARGTAVVTASVAGKTASETFVVQAGVAGTWSGTYTVEQCAAGSGSLHELICYPMNQGRTPGVLAVGATLPMTLQITKSGDTLTATAQLGELRGNLTGLDHGGNYLSLTGNLSVNKTTITVVQWHARVSEDVMEGVLGLEVRINGLPSHAQVAARIDKVTRR